MSLAVKVIVLVTLLEKMSLKTATTVAPLSPPTVITPVLAMASPLVAPSLMPLPKVTVGAAGAAVSNTKLVAVVLTFNATSLAVTTTLTVPSPKVLTSLEDKVIVWLVPLPVANL